MGHGMDQASGPGAREYERAGYPSPPDVEASVRSSTTIDSRMTELEATIEMLINATDNLGERLAPVLQPATPSDTQGTTEMKPSPYPVSGHSEAIGFARSRVDNVRARLVDFNHRLDFEIDD